MSSKIGIDIFSGAGGLSLGAEKSGIEVAVAIEKDSIAARTFQRNHAHTKVLCQDIIDINPSELSISNPFIVFGGPPCQGFSTSNRKTRNLDNTNNSLFKEFVRFVYILKPKWFVFENVEGIVNFNKGKTLKEIIYTFESIGYKIKWEILYASDFGVPQHRNRFFLIGNNQNIDFEFPPKLGYTVTVNDAIADLPDLENGDSKEVLPYKETPLSNYAVEMRRNSSYSFQNFVSCNKDYVIDRYKHIKPGQNWQAIPEELMNNYADKNKCHSGIYKRLDPEKPSVVISNYRKNMLIHPSQDRGLSVREAARLQSFPDDFIFEGSLMHIQQQIGNAVPPLLAKAVFDKILTY